MFKNGKLFNKINIVDLCVILVIVLLIVGATIKFGKFHSKTEETAQTNIEYQFTVNNIRDYTIDAFQVGDTVYDSQSGVDIGKVTNVEKTEAVTYEGTSTGEVVRVTNPYRYDMVLTIEAPVTVESDAYYINNSIELKVNSAKTIETKYVKTSGMVSDILED
ncbi:MAG: DUF4330 domain-containing protein [Clostridia bacterium]|nr:DUF4330 domain-containing protein [Clostridia bacterium]